MLNLFQHRCLAKETDPEINSHQRRAGRMTVNIHRGGQSSRLWLGVWRL